MCFADAKRLQRGGRKRRRTPRSLKTNTTSALGRPMPLNWRVGCRRMRGPSRWWFCGTVGVASWVPLVVAAKSEIPWFQSRWHNPQDVHINHLTWGLRLLSTRYKRNNPFGDQIYLLHRFLQIRNSVPETVQKRLQVLIHPGRLTWTLKTTGW